MCVSPVRAREQKKAPDPLSAFSCVDMQGRMFQVEYAVEATRRGRTVLGVCGEGCVVLVTRDPSPPSSCRAVGADGGVWAVDTHVGIAASG